MPTCIIWNFIIFTFFIISFINTLIIFSNSIDIPIIANIKRTTLNYNLIKDDRYNLLVKLGQEYYGGKFSTIENFMTQNEYLDFLKGYDIYICGELRQTGLGAINRALRLGIKVYLNGNNLEWFKQLGCVVYSTSQIPQQSFDLFEAPLSIDERITNYNCITTFLDESETLNKWVNYIEKHYKS